MNQKQLWNSIAPEWHKFKEPRERTLEFVKKQKGKILDLGSGSGRYLIKKPGLKFYLVDFSNEMIKLAREKAKELKIEAEFIISEADSLPFEDNFFDSALFDSALHCIKGKNKRQKSLKELYRVMKPNAKAKISVWNKNSERFKNSSKEKLVGWRDKGKRYYYLYEPEELYKEIEKAGFRILEKAIARAAIPVIIEKN